MPCANYTDPRLAAVYDTLNPAGRDTDFYLELAGSDPIAILDVGCGTGLLACRFAERGHRVTGADPAAAMLDIARRRPGGEPVTWVESDARSLALARPFDLIVMTGHAFQVLLTDAEIRAVLINLRKHLAHSGRLAFEARNPEVREWETWQADLTRERHEIPGIGAVEVCYQTREVTGEIVTYETRTRFGAGETCVGVDRLRFMSQRQLARLLADAGFAEIAWYGDWDRAPPGPGSPEIIVIASVAPAPDTGRQ